LVRSFFLHGAAAQSPAMASSSTRFSRSHIRRATVGRTSLDEWSVRRRDLYLTTHNSCNRQTSTPPVGFEPTISAGERPYTYALDPAAIGTGIWWGVQIIKFHVMSFIVFISYVGDTGKMECQWAEYRRTQLTPCLREELFT
jgi:hypothetical protein